MSTSTNQGGARAFLPRLPLPRPQLTVVPKTSPRPARLPFAVLVIAVLSAGLVGLLLLNTSMERGAYQVTALRAQTAALSAQQQRLEQQVAALQNPQQVAERALNLGMVVNANPAFLSLATGKILGHAVPGAAADRFDLGTPLGSAVDRLGKIAPVVGGAANSAGGVPVVHQGPKPPTKATPGNGTAGSPNSGN